MALVGPRYVKYSVYCQLLHTWRSICTQHAPSGVGAWQAAAAAGQHAAPRTRTALRRERKGTVKEPTPPGVM